MNFQLKVNSLHSPTDHGVWTENRSAFAVFSFNSELFIIYLLWLWLFVLHNFHLQNKWLRVSRHQAKNLTRGDWDSQMLACAERKIIPLWVVYHSLQTINLWKIVLGVLKTVCSPQILDLKGHDWDEVTPSLNKLVTRTLTVLSLDKVWGPEKAERLDACTHSIAHWAFLAYKLKTHIRFLMLRRQEKKGTIVCYNSATREKGLLAWAMTA